MKTKAKGKTLLQVVGIILIIWGAITLISGIISVVTANKAATDGGQMLDLLNSTASAAGLNYTYTASGLMISAIIAVVTGAVQLVAAIIGVVNCNKPEKAQICFIMGIVLIVVVLAESVYGAVSGTFSILSTILGLILPVLYFIGANFNKQAAEQNQPYVAEQDKTLE